MESISDCKMEEMIYYLLNSSVDVFPFFQNAFQRFHLPAAHKMQFRKIYFVFLIPIGFKLLRKKIQIIFLAATGILATWHLGNFATLLLCNFATLQL